MLKKHTLSTGMILIAILTILWSVSTACSNGLAFLIGASGLKKQKIYDNYFLLRQKG